MQHSCHDRGVLHQSPTPRSTYASFPCTRLCAGSLSHFLASVFVRAGRFATCCISLTCLHQMGMMEPSITFILDHERPVEGQIDPVHAKLPKFCASRGFRRIVPAHNHRASTTSRKRSLGCTASTACELLLRKWILNIPVQVSGHQQPSWLEKEHNLQWKQDFNSDAILPNGAHSKQGMQVYWEVLEQHNW